MRKKSDRISAGLGQCMGQSPENCSVAGGVGRNGIDALGLTPCYTGMPDAMRGDDTVALMMADQIALDPRLLRKRIDIVNAMGVTGERKNIGLNQIVIDSRLLPLINGKPQGLGLKNAGIQGGGKSHVLTTTLTIYPETAYHEITSGTAKSFYNMADSLKHKALIFSEGFALEARGSKDTEISYVVRSLMSKGSAEYQRTKQGCGARVTEAVRVDGPISFLTTTIQDKLEKQLEDRIFTVHPDMSADQTRKIIMKTAEMAAGVRQRIDDTTINAWKHFHDSLMPAEVIVPFAPKTGEALIKLDLPVSARRGYDRFVILIKAITLIYQEQRRRNSEGELIAEIADYAMALQLVENPVPAGAGSPRAVKDARILMIEEAGMISLKNLSEKAGISKAAMSEWVDLRVKSGILIWCDANGDSFDDETAVMKAKKMGGAFIRLVNSSWLPTPFELTGDSRWDKGGELYAMYDLHLDADGPVHDSDDALRDQAMLPRLPQVNCSGSAPEDRTAAAAAADGILDFTDDIPGSKVFH